MSPDPYPLLALADEYLAREVSIDDLREAVSEELDNEDLPVEALRLLRLLSELDAGFISEERFRRDVIRELHLELTWLPAFSETSGGQTAELVRHLGQEVDPGANVAPLTESNSSDRVTVAHF
ncbi:hypothetical protein [Luteitalea sp.]